MDDARTYQTSPLKDYYERFTPDSAADALGFPVGTAPALQHLPPAAYVFPWDTTNPEDALSNRSKWISQEAHEWDRALGLEDGIHHFGPVSLEKGQMEIDRLSSLRERIETSGFQRSDESDGDAKGRLLTQSDGEWCVHISPGQHRLAVAAALGLDAIPVRFERAAVLRETVAYWPQVVAGRVTEDGALAVFDRFMRGDAPPAYQPPANRLRSTG